MIQNSWSRVYLARRTSRQTGRDDAGPIRLANPCQPPTFVTVTAGFSVTQIRSISRRAVGPKAVSPEARNFFEAAEEHRAMVVLNHGFHCGVSSDPAGGLQSLTDERPQILGVDREVLVKLS
jgi:hypothetical protein